MILIMNYHALELGPWVSDPQQNLFEMSCNDLMVGYVVMNVFVKWSCPLKGPYYLMTLEREVD